MEEAWPQGVTWRDRSVPCCFRPAGPGFLACCSSHGTSQCRQQGRESGRSRCPAPGSALWLPNLCCQAWATHVGISISPKPSCVGILAALEPPSEEQAESSSQ